MARPAGRRRDGGAGAQRLGTGAAPGRRRIARGPVRFVTIPQAALSAQPDARQRWLGIALLACVGIGFGLNWPAMKLCLLEIPLWTYRSLCVIGGAAGLVLIAAATGQSLRIPP